MYLIAIFALLMGNNLEKKWDTTLLSLLERHDSFSTLSVSVVTVLDNHPKFQF